jgi:hypothetical protein
MLHTPKVMFKDLIQLVGPEPTPDAGTFITQYSNTSTHPVDAWKVCPVKTPSYQDAGVIGF